MFANQRDTHGVCLHPQEAGKYRFQHPATTFFLISCSLHLQVPARFNVPVHLLCVLQFLWIQLA